MIRGYRNNITAERARERFLYDPATGVFRNRVNSGKARVGEVAGSERPDGYRVLRFGRGPQYLAHRIAWLYVHGKWPKKHLDHIDQDPRNNAINNLRECDDAQNAQNLSPDGYGTSGYLGVTRYTKDDTNRWVAKIKVRKKAINLGVYNCRTAAYVAYCKAKVMLHTFATGSAATTRG